MIHAIVRLENEEGLVCSRASKHHSQPHFDSFHGSFEGLDGDIKALQNRRATHFVSSSSHPQSLNELATGPG